MIRRVRRLIVTAVVVGLVLTGMTGGEETQAQDDVSEAARGLFEKHKRALVVVTVAARLVATTDGDPFAKRAQKRRTLGVTIHSDNGLIVISNAAVDPSVGLRGKKAQMGERVVTIQTARADFEEVEIRYGNSEVVRGKIIKQDVESDVAFVLPDPGSAEALKITSFPAIDLDSAILIEEADQVVGLSRASVVYDFMPTVIVGRVTGVFKTEYRTCFVTSAGTAQGNPIFSLDGKAVGITLERIVDSRRTGVLGTMAAGSIKVMAELALSAYETSGRKR